MVLVDFDFAAAVGVEDGFGEVAGQDGEPLLLAQAGAPESRDAAGGVVVDAFILLGDGGCGEGVSVGGWEGGEQEWGRKESSLWELQCCAESAFEERLGGAVHGGQEVKMDEHRWFECSRFTKVP